MHFALSSPKPEGMQGFCSEGHWNSDMYQDTVCELYNLSLVQGVEVTGTQVSFSLHPLIRGWLQLRQTPDEQQEFLVESLIMLAEFTLLYRSDFLSYSVCVELSTHLKSWLESDEAVPLSHNTEPPKGWGGEAPVIQSNILTLLRFFLLRPEGKEELSERLGSRNVDGCTKHLGRNHSYTTQAMTQLGRVYQAQGRVEEADAMYRDAFNPGDPPSNRHLPSDLMEGMADVAQLQGRYKMSAGIRHLIFQNSLLNNRDQSIRSAINAGKTYQEAQDFVTAAIFMEAAALVLVESKDQYPVDRKQFKYLGEHYMSRNKLVEAEKYFTRCLSSTHERLHVSTPWDEYVSKQVGSLKLRNTLSKLRTRTLYFMVLSTARLAKL